MEKSRFSRQIINHWPELECINCQNVNLAPLSVLSQQQQYNMRRRTSGLVESHVCSPKTAEENSYKRRGI